MEETDQPCGESRVLLNGLQLDSVWDGTTAQGHDYLDLRGGKEAEWHIRCLFDNLSGGEGVIDEKDVIHVLSLRIGSSMDTVRPGFTISYKQRSKPAILRFQPQYHTIETTKRPTSMELWRIPSLEFSPELLDKAQEFRSPTVSSILGHGQKSLGAYFRSLKGSLKKEVHEAIEHICPIKYAQSKKLTPPVPLTIPLDQTLESPEKSSGEGLTSTKTVDSSNTFSNHPAAETRSLNALETSDPSYTDATRPSFTPQTNHNLHFLKTFGLVLILGACVTWICLRCRDPRRRAECLARREERRNKKLYRRAVRQHKIRMWFWNFRMKYGLAPSEVLDWDEKRNRVIQQESVLEHVANGNIQALRDAHGSASNMVAAEEGRNAFAYSPEGSERRQSMSTLPGYESEGSQPPTYDDVSGALEGTAVVDGFRYVSAETEFRSDSSVISTSPRISRDGTNSDFDEKIEPISLERVGPAGPGF